MSLQLPPDTLNHGRTLLRATLEALLAEVLDREPSDLPLNKSFLALGGDSLIAIELMAKCRERGIEIDIANLLKAGTVSELIDYTLDIQPNDTDVAMPDSAKPLTDSNITLSSTAKDGASLLFDKTIAGDTPSFEISSSELESFFARVRPIAKSLEDVQDVGTCSVMQNNFLISQKLDPDAYRCSFTLRVTSKTTQDLASFTPQAIADSWAKIVERHSILRTTLVESQHRPAAFDQVVWKTVPPQVIYEQDPATVLNTPLLNCDNSQVSHRLMLARASSTEILMRLDISHALVDGQSAEVILRDFCAAYKADIPPHAIPSYTDFVKYEQHIQVDHAATYWNQYLLGAQPSYLPLKNSQEQLNGFSTIRNKLDFPEGVLDAFCGTHGVTVANICQVAWGLVLRCFTNSENVCFSYVTAGRQIDIQGIHDAVGVFLTTLICRIDFTASSTVSDMLTNVRDRFIESAPYQNAAHFRSKHSNIMSPRQLGNSLLSFHRLITPDMEFGKAGLGFEVVKRITPTDVSHLSQDQMLRG